MTAPPESGLPDADLGEVRAVILCGGRGTRLAPYTTVLPKPLMPVGDMPILELLIRRLRAAGVRRVTLAVGHLSSLLMAYFGHGEKLDVDLDYSLEEEPLGTAGPLRQVEGLDRTFLVLNGDLLTDLRFEQLVSTHRHRAGVATVGTYHREIKIDLGVIELSADGEVAAYAEKPVFQFQVSMGVYVFEPSVLELIGPGERLDLPDLVLRLLGAGHRVVSHDHLGYWLDIGRPDDYEQAQEDFQRMRSQLLPE